jgi:MOSC domain-containing protein YiiM
LEHYSFWRQFLGKEYIEIGSFGENLTTEGLLDADVYMGDYWQFGTAVLMAVQPRMPCSKIGLRFNDPSMTKHFARARRNGFYFRVVQEGVLQAGDSIHLVKRSDYAITIQDVVDSYATPKKNPERVKQILDIPFLPELLKSSFYHFIK